MKECHNIFLVLYVVCMVALCGTALHVYAQEAPATSVQLPENIPSNEPTVQELSPQNQNETPKTEEVKEPKVVVNPEPVDALKKEEKKPAVTTEATQKTDTPKRFKMDTKSLLSITDGAFRYSRIPGITIKEHNEQIIAQTEEEKHNIDANEKGLFGLSKQASDRLAKIILIVIIAFVFILYRMRTRSTSGSVLRRFPK